MLMAIGASLSSGWAVCVIALALRRRKLPDRRVHDQQ